MRMTASWFGFAEGIHRLQGCGAMIATTWQARLRSSCPELRCRARPLTAGKGSGPKSVRTPGSDRMCRAMGFRGMGNLPRWTEKMRVRGKIRA
jgi:hypothetical protein